MSRWYAGENRKCLQCGTIKYFAPWQLKKGEGKYCSRTCKHMAMKGKPLVTVKPLGHTYLTKNGYRMVKVGRERSKSGYIAEHRLVVEDVLGRPLTSDEHVHHDRKDEKSNNAPSNLVLLTNSDHQSLHNQLHSQSRKVPVTCALEGCEVVMMRKPSRSTGNCYCSNAHRLEAMHEKASAYHAQRRYERFVEAMHGKSGVYHAK